jgi:hypothetical protein
MDRHALLTPRLLTERLPVWSALSDLFLDTQLDESDHRRIAIALRQSSYSALELHHILRDEVTPAFGWNLAAAAGEWAGWTDEAVQEIMTRSLRKWAVTTWLARVGTRFAWRSIQPDWHSIRALLD